MVPPTSQSSSQVDFHHKALTEPFVKLSLHTALRIPIMVSNREPNVCKHVWLSFCLLLKPCFSFDFIPSEPFVLVPNPSAKSFIQATHGITDC